MIESISLIQSWYIALPCLFIVLQIALYFHTQYLIRKLGAKPMLNVRSDGWFGFKEGKAMLKAIEEGRVLHLGVAKYYKVDHPEVPTYFERIFGKGIIFTKDPENIKAILATQFTDFGLGHRLRYFDPLLGKGIFTLDHAGWKDSRAMLRPQFAREQVAHVRSLEPHIQYLFKHIDLHKGEYFDIQELFFRFTVDSATEFLFGSSVSSLQDESIGCNTKELDFAGRLQFPAAFNKSQLYLATRNMLQTLYWLVNPKEFQECNKVVHDFANHYVNLTLSYSPEELEEKSNGYVFLYELAKQTRDAAVLRDQSLNILLAGRDTTAGLLSFAIFELARNPDMYAKLRKEILERFGPTDLEDITFESLKSCEYLKAVLNETLRLYPSVPRNARLATKNTTLPHGGGPDGTSPIFIPKNAVVTYNISATQCDPYYYGKDADVYRPERWFEESTRKLGWAYLPFNGGPRICLGQQFALTEASYVVTRIAQTFSKLELQDRYEYPPKTLVHLTMCLFDGAWVKMER
ncbi:uncharacterized protein LODBEIA_P16020 [Lodderomyces beijingensis]|uniref:Uncharacterized protein n=1 Tax=Lodderomyces beijingensis TaxID=1775926 RepID=A0ABP0ZGT7_9ASCO